jgi:hypothetical protein
VLVQPRKFKELGASAADEIECIDVIDKVPRCLSSNWNHRGRNGTSSQFPSASRTIPGTTGLTIPSSHTSQAPLIRIDTVALLLGDVAHVRHLVRMFRASETLDLLRSVSNKQLFTRGS